jgi:hypothetical protein
MRSLSTSLIAVANDTTSLSPSPHVSRWIRGFQVHQMGGALDLQLEHSEDGQNVPASWLNQPAGVNMSDNVKDLNSAHCCRARPRSTISEQSRRDKECIRGTA